MKIRPQLLQQKVGEEMVLLDPKGESYFGLDAIGVRVWELLSTGCDARQIVETMKGEYDVEEDVLRQDVQRFLSDLESSGLITSVSEQS